MRLKIKSDTRKALPTGRQRKRLMLTPKDRRVFFDALMTPPPVSERLKRALAAARQRIGN